MTIATRKPTGLPPWPIVLLAGREKAGKSFGAAAASASPLVGRTLWIGVGEDDPDEYGRVPGADFDIVLHDGTKDGIVAAVEAAVAEPTVDGKPTLIVFDSATKYWELLVENVQGIANQRGNGKKTASGDYAISPDLWNVAKSWWYDAFGPLLSHRGPVIVTARLEEVMVMENGQPTKQKTWKVQAHKSLPYDVGVVIEMHERGHALINGVRSVSMALERPEEIRGGIAVVDLWTRMGLNAKAQTSDRVHARTVADDQSLEGIVARWRAKGKAATTEAEHIAIWKDAVDRVKNNEIPGDVLDVLREEASAFKRGNQLPATEDAPKLPGTAASPPAQRDWVKEGEALETAAAVRELAREAEQLGAGVEVVATLSDIAATKEGEVGAEAAGTWAKPEGAPDDWNRAAVLDEVPEGAADEPAAEEAPADQPAKDAAPAVAEEEEPF